MCTVTVIPLPAGRARAPAGLAYRVAANRDELRTRSPALPPMRHDAFGRAAGWPVDRDAGGTWIGANDAGLTLCLLNAHPKDLPVPGPHGPLRSRGEIVPLLMGHAIALDSARALARLDLGAYAPFRLIGVDGLRIVEALWDRRRLTVGEHAMAARCIVSSGLGDHLVMPRMELFDEMISRAGATPDTQDAFHAHRWPDKPEISVRMSRADARTMSTTVVEVGDRVRMTHADDAGEHGMTIDESRTAVGAGATAAQW